MRKTHDPLWSTPHRHIAFDNTSKVVAYGHSPALARISAIIAGIESPHILSKSDVQRPTIELKDIKPQSLVLMVHQKDHWKQGRLFWIKNIRQSKDILEKDIVRKVLVRGNYLDELLAMPWFILTDAYIFSTTIERYYYSDGKRYFVYEPVIVEVKPYLQKIRRSMQVNVFSSAVSNYKKQNIQIQKMFELLNSQIQEDEKEKK